MQVIKAKCAAVLLLLLISTQSRGADYMMYIGAGGEEEKADTIFDGTIKNMGKFALGSPATKMEVALNGGHSKTEALIKKSFPLAESRTGFREADYLRLLQSYKLKLENNEMVPGDQFMIYIDSHGAQKENAYKTHRIATSGAKAENLNTLTGADVVDLDQLESLKKLAKDKGVKMAIIDVSCHSGNTLVLADDNTCVISASGPNHFAFGDFSQNFVKAMKKGKNLEQIFLEVRAIDDTPSLPMISSAAGLAVNNIVYDKITPFLYYFDQDHDKLLPFLENNNSEAAQCVANENFNALMETIKNLEDQKTDINKALKWTNKKKVVDLSALKKLLGKYKKSLDLVTLKMRELDLDRLKKEELFDATVSLGEISARMKKTYTWKELIEADFSKLIQNIQRRITAETHSRNMASLEVIKSIYLQAQTKKEELLSANPDLVAIPEKEKQIKKLIESNYFINRSIAIEERKLYSALYNNEQANTLSETNPCSSFKL